MDSRAYWQCTEHKYLTETCVLNSVNVLEPSHSNKSGAKRHTKFLWAHITKKYRVPSTVNRVPFAVQTVGCLQHFEEHDQRVL